MSKLSIPKKDLVIVSGSAANGSPLLMRLLARVDGIAKAVIETTDGRLAGRTESHVAVSPETFQRNLPNYAVVGRNVYGNSGIVLPETPLSVAFLDPLTDAELLEAALASAATSDRVKRVLGIYLNDPRNPLRGWEEQDLKNRLRPMQRPFAQPSVEYGPKAAMIEFDASKRDLDQITSGVMQYIRTIITRQAA